MAIELEHTDTFGGESNYSWVRRAQLPERSHWTDRAIVRAAKRWAGLTGIRCRVEKFGDMIAIYPRGICHVVFATYADKSALPISE